MSKLNTLTAAAAALAISTAPIQAKSAELVDTVPDANGKTVGGFIFKWNGLVGMTLDDTFTIAVGAHQENAGKGGIGFDIASKLKLSDSVKFGVAYEADTHGDEEDAQHLLGPTLNTRFGKHDRFGFDMEMPIKLLREANDNQPIGGFNATLSHEFKSGAYLSLGYQGKYEADQDTHCGLAGIGYRGWEVNGEKALDIGTDVGPCSVVVTPLTTGKINAVQLGFHLNLIPNIN